MSIVVIRCRIRKWCLKSYKIMKKILEKSYSIAKKKVHVTPPSTFRDM